MTTILEDALRSEILKLLEEKPMTSATLRRVSKFCQTSATLLLVTEKFGVSAGDAALGEMGGDNISEGIGGYGGAIAGAPNSENFGTRTIREILAMAPALIQQSHETPSQLVAAIRAARDGGMPELATELENKFLGKTVKSVVNESIDAMASEASKAPTSNPVSPMQPEASV